MSWQAVSLAILVLVIAAGFAWYERSRPPSRIVALVAALAALAVAGRLLVAPIPNVVATTDIVLFTGYAIGGGPGFVVGALAALVSNFWLGQGPWTPWQMAGWGMVGIGGAALAAATGRHLGRIGLAVACGLAGLAYGALLDLSVMVTYGGEQSLDRYLALSVRGIPFNVAHAAGNLVLALVAGPALVRMLERFRQRCEFRWRERVATASVVAVSAVGAVLILAAPAGAGDASAAARVEAAAVGAARSWLQHARNSDGGFGTAPGGSSSSAMTGWAMLGLEAAGRNPLDLDAGGENPVSYLRANAEKVRSTGDIERTILALAGAGVNPRTFGGRDLVSALRARRGNGSFQGQVNLTAFGIFALRAAGADGSELSRSGAWLRRAQSGGGGWGYQPDQPSESDSTGAALQALAAAGGGGDAAADGARYLSRTQAPDGGWALGESGPTNSQSTAWAIQGLLAAGRDPGSVTNAGRDPFEYLRARQASDGHYRYSASSDQTPVWVTGQVLVAASRETFPLAAVPRAPGSGGASGARGGGDTGGDGVARNGEGGERTAQGAEANHRNGSGGPQSGGKDASASGGPAETVVPVGQPTSPEDGDFATDTQLALGALGLLAVLLGAGFFLYRRRLPL
jgi:energy-coupling factor transport system substrate-specific component